MREYEACFVIHPQVDEAGIEKEIGAVTDTIAAGSGELVGVHKWGRRKMAYMVRNVRDGFYVLARFNGEPSLLTELDRRFKMNENILRHLVVRSADDEFPPDLRAREPRRGLRGEGLRGDGPPRGRRRDEGDDLHTPSRGETSRETPAATATEAVATKAPAEQAPVEQAPVEQAPVEQTPAERAPAEQAPAEQAPAEQAPAERAPAEPAPAERAPAEPQAPAEGAPSETEKG